MTDARRRLSTPLGAKLAATGGIVGSAQAIVHPDHEIGAVLGGVAFATLAVLVATRPIAARHAPARIALIAGAVYAIALVDSPDPLALLLFLIALSMATLLPQRRFGSALAWLPRLAWHGTLGFVRPWRDLAWAGAARRRRHGADGGLRAVAQVLAIPLVGAALFLTLFAAANPLIASAFARIALPDLGTVIWRTMLAAVVGMVIWTTLRPRLPVTNMPILGPGAARVDVSVATLVLSLVTFNAIFAVQNALDIAFLWSGAALPVGVTMADYAHRGAYALIVTALLAAVFVLVTLRPGGAAAASPAIRRLVTGWIAQTLLLVASSALRLLDYIDAYAMTMLRLAALMWMALVATGLGLILWRLLRGYSATWLINANAAAAALVLSVAATVDLGAAAAAWNVRTALSQGRAGPRLDLCYLESLGSSGLVALATLERHAKHPALRERLAHLRRTGQARLEVEQHDWHSWTWRGARRLTQIAALVGSAPPKPTAYVRLCDGRVVQIAAAAPQRLTRGPQR